MDVNHCLFLIRFNSTSLNSTERAGEPRSQRDRQSGANLAAGGPISLGFGCGFGHVAPLLGMTVIAITGAMVDLGFTIDPHLTAARHATTRGGLRWGGFGSGWWW